MKQLEDPKLSVVDLVNPDVSGVQNSFQKEYEPRLFRTSFYTSVVGCSDAFGLHSTHGVYLR